MRKSNLLDLFVSVRTDGAATVGRDLAAIEAAGKKTDKALSSSMRSVGSSMQNVGKSLSLFVTAPLAIAGAAAVKMGASYDQALTNAVSVTGKTGKAADQLKAKMNALALQLGAETKFSASEAAGAMYDLASSGWSVEQMQKGLNGIMALAAATQTELADATAVVVSTISQYGMKASDSAHVSDVFTAAINKSRATMDGLGTAMGYVGPVASAMGISLEETVSVLSKMADSGIEASTAGTSLRAALASLANPIGQGAKELKAMKVSFDDVNPATHSLTEILKTLNDAGLDANGAMKIFGREAGPAMLAVSKTGVASVNELTKALERSGGTAERTAKEQLDTLAGRWEALKGSIETVAITYYQKVEPFLKSMVEKLIPIVNAFGELSPGMQTAILAFAGFALAIGPVLFVLGSMVAAFGALAGVFSGGVLVAGVAAFSAAILGLSQINFGDALERAKTFAKNLQEALKPPTVNDARLGGKPEQGGASGFVAGMIQSVQVAIPKIKEAFGTVSDVIRSTVGSVVDWLKGAFQTLWPYIEPAINNFVQGFKALQPAIAPLLAFLSGVLKGAFMAIVPIIGTVLVVAVNALALAFRGIAEVVGWVGQKLTPFIPIVKTVGTVIGYVLGTLIGSSVSLATKALSFLFPKLALLGPAFTRILTRGRSVFGALGTVFKTLWQRAVAIFQTGQKVVTGVFRVIGAAARVVGSVISKAWTSAGKTTTRVFSAIAGFLRRIWNSIQAFILKTALKIYNSILGKWLDIQKTTTTVFNTVKEAIGSKLTTAYNTAKDVASKLWNTLKSAWQTIKDGTAAAWSAVAVAIWEPVERAVERVRNAIDAIKTIVGGVLEAFGQDNPFKGTSPPDNSGQRRQGAGQPVREFAKGGLGTSGKQPRMHLWNEQQGNEAFIAEKRPAKEQLPYLQTAAGWHGYAVVPSDPIKTAGSSYRDFATGGLVRAFAGGGIGAMYEAVKQKFGVEGFNRHGGYLSGSGATNSLDFMVTTPGNIAQGSQKELGDNIAAFTAPPSAKNTIWYGQANFGSGWQPYETGPGVGNANTLKHMDHVHAEAFPDSFRGAQGTFTPGAGGGGGLVASLAEQMWNGTQLEGWKGTVKDGVLGAIPFIGGALKAGSNAFPGLSKLLPDKLPDFGQGIFADALDSFAAKYKDSWVKDWIYSKFGGSSGPGGTGGFTGGGDPAKNRTLGQKMFESSGVPGTFSALDLLWTKESGWNHLADNPTSDAYGIPQAMTSAHAMPAGYGPPGGDPPVQINWGLDYIRDRWGSTDAAWGNSQKYNWYSKGGMTNGPQKAILGEAGRELVMPLDNAQVIQQARHAMGTTEISARLESLEQTIRDGIDINDFRDRATGKMLGTAENGARRVMKGTEGRNIVKQHGVQLATAGRRAGN